MIDNSILYCFSDDLNTKNRNCILSGSVGFFFLSQIGPSFPISIFIAFSFQHIIFTIHHSPFTTANTKTTPSRLCCDTEHLRRTTSPHRRTLVPPTLRPQRSLSLRLVVAHQAVVAVVISRTRCWKRQRVCSIYRDLKREKRELCRRVPSPTLEVLLCTDRRCLSLGVQGHQGSPPAFRHGFLNFVVAAIKV